MKEHYVQAPNHTPELVFTESDIVSMQRFGYITSEPLCITFAKLKHKDSDQIDLCAIAVVRLPDGKIVAEPYAVVIQNTDFDTPADRYEKPSEQLDDFLNDVVLKAVTADIAAQTISNEIRERASRN